MSVTRLTTAGDIEEQFYCVCCPKAVRRTIATMLDFQLMKLMSCDLMILSGIFTTLGLYPPFVFVTEKAKAMGIEEENATFLVSVIGIANAVGRILCGAVSFVPVCNVTILTYVTLILCGGSLIASNYMCSFNGQLICAAGFGGFIAVYLALRTIMMVDQYGIENLTNCYGLNLLFQGVAAVCSVPLASLIKESTGSFDASYLAVGCFMIISGILLIPVPRLANSERQQKKIPSNK